MPRIRGKSPVKKPVATSISRSFTFCPCRQASRQNDDASKSGRFRLFHRRFACRRNTPPLPRLLEHKIQHGKCGFWYNYYEPWVSPCGLSLKGPRSSHEIRIKAQNPRRRHGHLAGGADERSLGARALEEAGRAVKIAIEKMLMWRKWYNMSISTEAVPYDN